MTIPCARECRVMDLRRQVAKADGNSHCIGNVNKSEDSGKHTARGAPPKRAISTHFLPPLWGLRRKRRDNYLIIRRAKYGVCSHETSRRLKIRDSRAAGTCCTRPRNVFHPPPEHVPPTSATHCSARRKKSCKEKGG